MIQSLVQISRMPQKLHGDHPFSCLGTINRNLCRAPMTSNGFWFCFSHRNRSIQRSQKRLSTVVSTLRCLQHKRTFIETPLVNHWSSYRYHLEDCPSMRPIVFRFPRSSVPLNLLITVIIFLFCLCAECCGFPKIFVYLGRNCKAAPHQNFYSEVLPLPTPVEEDGL